MSPMLLERASVAEDEAAVGLPPLFTLSPASSYPWTTLGKLVDCARNRYPTANDNASPFVRRICIFKCRPTVWQARGFVPQTLRFPTGAASDTRESFRLTSLRRFPLSHYFLSFQLRGESFPAESGTRFGSRRSSVTAVPPTCFGPMQCREYRESETEFRNNENRVGGDW